MVKFSEVAAFFSEPWINGILSAPGPNNGRYQYGSGGSMPSNSWNATNYFVDVDKHPFCDNSGGWAWRA